jgi:hypothetical protein
VWRSAASGRNRCAAFHPEDFVEAELLGGSLKLEVFVPGGATPGREQDAYLVRKT